MKQMITINKTIVELCQKLTEAKIHKGKQITYLIILVAKLTKFLTEKSTKTSGSERCERTAASWYGNRTSSRKSTIRECAERMKPIRRYSLTIGSPLWNRMNWDHGIKW